MKTWNVLTGVVQLVDADTAEEAQRKAQDQTQVAVDKFGDVYDLTDLFTDNPGVVCEEYQMAFESDTDQEGKPTR
jgi:hypothetical protein